MSEFMVRQIGLVRSPLADRSAAPLQGFEGGPSAWLEFDADVAEGLSDVGIGDDLYLLTWFHLADRSVLSLHPRGDPANPVTGVFSTRSPDRPNPIGLHRVTVLETEPARLHVSDLEAVDGTPIIDVKPVLPGGA